MGLPGEGSSPSGEVVMPFVAPCRPLSLAAPLEWLRLGWNDLTAAPWQGAFYGFLLASLGALIALLTWKFGLLALYVGLASGFVFVGPFLATGFYSISYQRERGEQPTLASGFRLGLASLRDTLVLGVCLLVVLLVWARAGMIMSVFRPSDAFPTWHDLIPYLSIGTVVGAFFCAIVFAATAFSLPMLLDRRTDAVTAVVTSINATLRNKLAMLLWGALIVTSVLVGFATMFLGFIVLLPVIGHATWHSYRQTIDITGWPPRQSDLRSV
ncbi:MAG TPA: DUF2189 domain-containing protein [Steroidobacteraceae bacterium]